MARATPGTGGDSRMDAAPLTVAAVARTLGVAASTLRTWDRRYGLGPSSHQAGSHRRYTPDDVARLQTMRRLTLRGVAPVDAARIATEPGTGDSRDGEETGPAEEADDGSLALDPLTLAAAAVEPDLRRVHRMLSRATREAGVVAVWADLVQPAAEMVDQGRHRLAQRPGSDPHGVMRLGLMQAIRELAVPGPAPVRVLAPAADRVSAHVIAGGLAEAGVGALVVPAEHLPVDTDPLAWLPEGEVAVLAVIGNPPGAEEVVTRSSERGDVNVFLLGDESPSLWLPHVHRVRTPAAAVAEIAATVRD
ncbi:MerR family transcriptional regulator [Georgenia satyanarayanai]|uniref:MerR family transcriptional regulator n=1 Tax=Georgenia satyanarayanai TaxID=860221 RepID=UPI001D01C0E3|nr:MerR family transcriptional regulator [Georgenia satyanarayanai]